MAPLLLYHLPMTYPDDDVIRIGRDADERDDDEYADEPNLGPDARDMDLMDGSWEDRYYGGHVRQRDWRAIGAAISVLVLLGLLVPAVAVLRG